MSEIPPNITVRVDSPGKHPVEMPGLELMSAAALLQDGYSQELRDLLRDVNLVFYHADSIRDMVRALYQSVQSLDQLTELPSTIVVTDELQLVATVKPRCNEALSPQQNEDLSMLANQIYSIGAVINHSDALNDPERVKVMQGFWQVNDGANVTIVELQECLREYQKFLTVHWISFDQSPQKILGLQDLILDVESLPVSVVCVDTRSLVRRLMSDHPVLSKVGLAAIFLTFSLALVGLGAYVADDRSSDQQALTAEDIKKKNVPVMRQFAESWGDLTREIDTFSENMECKTYVKGVAFFAKEGESSRAFFHVPHQKDPNLGSSREHEARLIFTSVREIIRKCDSRWQADVRFFTSTLGDQEVVVAYKEVEGYLTGYVTPGGENSDLRMIGHFVVWDFHIYYFWLTPEGKRASVAIRYYREDEVIPILATLDSEKGVSTERIELGLIDPSALNNDGDMSVPMEVKELPSILDEISDELTDSAQSAAKVSQVSEAPLTDFQQQAQQGWRELLIEMKPQWEDMKIEMVPGGLLVLPKTLHFAVPGAKPLPICLFPSGRNGTATALKYLDIRACISQCKKDWHRSFGSYYFNNRTRQATVYYGLVKLASSEGLAGQVLFDGPGDVPRFQYMMEGNDCHLFWNDGSGARRYALLRHDPQHWQKPTLFFSSDATEVNQAATNLDSSTAYTVEMNMGLTERQREVVQLLPSYILHHSENLLGRPISDPPRPR